jgi:hypothetical protein
LDSDWTYRTGKTSRRDPNGFKNPGLNNLGQLLPSPLIMLWEVLTSAKCQKYFESI